MSRSSIVRVMVALMSVCRNGCWSSYFKSSCLDSGSSPNESEERSCTREGGRLVDVKGDTICGLWDISNVLTGQSSRPISLNSASNVLSRRFYCFIFDHGVNVFRTNDIQAQDRHLMSLLRARVLESGDLPTSWTRVMRSKKRSSRVVLCWSKKDRSSGPVREMAPRYNWRSFGK